MCYTLSVFVLFNDMMQFEQNFNYSKKNITFKTEAIGLNRLDMHHFNQVCVVKNTTENTDFKIFTANHKQKIENLQYKQMRAIHQLSFNILPQKEIFKIYKISL